MKKMKSVIIESTMERLKAFSIIKRTDTVKASDYVGKPFTIADYVKSHNTISDMETGEVTEMETLTIVTTDGAVIGTNSPTLVNNLDEINDVLTDSDMKFSDVQLVIKKGKSKNGREFSTIELVL